MADFTHFNEEGRASMVDVGGKEITTREAVAVGRVLVNEECFEMIRTGGHKKGDVLGTEHHFWGWGWALRCLKAHEE